jgi:hypothetical protein
MYRIYRRRDVVEVREQDRWRLLCEQATMEEDPKKLLELIQEINRLLDVNLEKKPTRQASRPAKTA